MNIFSLHEGVVIVDAGGGTVDVSSYKRVERETKRIFSEIVVSRCNSESRSILSEIQLFTIG